MIRRRPFFSTWFPSFLDILCQTGLAYIVSEGQIMTVNSAPTAELIREQAAREAFGRPLVSNIYRGLIAEIIVGEALGADWHMCSGDWRGWDFQHRDGCRLRLNNRQRGKRGRGHAARPSQASTSERARVITKEEVDCRPTPLCRYLRVRLPPDL